MAESRKQLEKQQKLIDHQATQAIEFAKTQVTDFLVKTEDVPSYNYLVYIVNEMKNVSMYSNEPLTYINSLRKRFENEGSQEYRVTVKAILDKLEERISIVANPENLKDKEPEKKENKSLYGQVKTMFKHDKTADVTNQIEKGNKNSPGKKMMN